MKVHKIHWSPILRDHSALAVAIVNTHAVRALLSREDMAGLVTTESVLAARTRDIAREYVARAVGA